MLMKYDNAEFYEKLSSHFNFHLDLSISTTTSYEKLNMLLRYIQYNSLSIYWTKKCFE
jgi:hypothetical protein